MLIALTRRPPASMAACELTYMSRDPIDLGRARAQHAAYEQALRDAGAEVISLPALEAHPDCVFVEDVALVFETIAIRCRMGAASREGEAESIFAALGASRDALAIEPPATLEGGDVLRVGDTVFVGQSTRTSAPGLGQLRAMLGPLGLDVRSVNVAGCLHLSTGASPIDERLVLANPEWVDVAPFKDSGVEVIPVDTNEPWAANTARVNGALLLAAGHPKTQKALERRGLDVRAADISEFAKAEAGLTCMRLLFEADPAQLRIETASSPGVAATQR